MAASHLFTVVGDGNVRRNMTTMNRASRPAMSNAKVIDCLALSTVRSSLLEVPEAANVCIFQSVSAILASSADTGSIFGTIDPVLTELASVLREFCEARSSIQILVAPPMFRLTPVWYHRHLPEISHQFSTAMTSNRPRNLHLLSSPVCQDLCDDGIFLNPVAGLHYLLHLFDDAQRVVDASAAKGLKYFKSLLVIIVSEECLFLVYPFNRLMSIAQRVIDASASKGLKYFKSLPVRIVS